MKWVTKELINKGWSDDKKYHVVDANGIDYLLRVSAISQYARKKKEFNLMKTIESTGIRMCNPIKFGICADGVYSVQRWIDGEDAETFILKLSESQQYEYGFQAGQILKKIHGITVHNSKASFDKINRKIDLKIKNYQMCSIKHNKGNIFIDYINNNRHLVKNRPVVLQHGDFHRGNLMVDKDENINVIDFGKIDYGDPWEEMKTITWDVQMSPSFACGRIDGYFQGGVPEEFWRVLALYISIGAVSLLPWSIKFGDEEIQTVKNQMEDILRWYDDMKLLIPNWYLKK